MSLVSKENAKRFRKQVIGTVDPRGLKLAGTLFHQFNDLHSIDYWQDKEIEQILLKQKKQEVEQIGKRNNKFKNYIRFSPSGASKCERELFFKAIKQVRDEQRMFPYQKRWTRNSTAVHEVVQRDLLYMEKMLEKPEFTVARTEDGLPAWEGNIKNGKIIKHNGVEFVLNGMMDGVLDYHPEGIKVGFEFKTKSTTIAQVGNYKMKDAQDSHKTQCVAYSILFGVDEFILMYESVAKDGWMKGAEAKSDIRTFYHKVTEADRVVLLDKFARVTKMVQKEQIPQGDSYKCIFCEYKTICKSLGDV